MNISWDNIDKLEDHYITYLLYKESRTVSQISKIRNLSTSQVNDQLIKAKLEIKSMLKDKVELSKDVIDKFVIKFSESTKDAFDKKRLTEAFEKYLYKQVEAEEKINQNFNIDDKSDMESFLKYVTDDVIKLPLEKKRQMLIRDESFETIRSISNNAFEMAQEAYTSKSDNIDETKVDEMQKKLNELLKSVKAFNKQQAIWLVSEGILDLNFVKNPKTDIMSIRLGRCLQSK